VRDYDVRLVGVEAGGEGVDSSRHAATLVAGSFGVLHGASMYLLQDADGQVMGTHSVSAGLDYPGVGPEHSYLKETGRAEYTSVTDTEALEAFELLCRLEGIIPALETAHAVAEAVKRAREMTHEQVILVNHSGRGDKDLGTIVGREDAESAI
jgi:tryptophan synthase beta chain